MGFLYRHRVVFGFISLALAVAVTFGICFFALARTAAESLRLTVVIDAGHGGVDGGVVGTSTGTKESDINLAISRILAREFEDAGFFVVQPRRGSMELRPRDINGGIWKNGRRSSTKARRPL